MRAFEIYVKGNQVACDIPKMHVSEDLKENFAVHLKSDLETEYILADLSFEDNERPWLTQQRLNNSTIILKDNNAEPSRPKFIVKLTSRGSSPKPTPTSLDPYIVNE